MSRKLIDSKYLEFQKQLRKGTLMDTGRSTIIASSDKKYCTDGFTFYYFYNAFLIFFELCSLTIQCVYSRR